MSTTDTTFIKLPIKISHSTIDSDLGIAPSDEDIEDTFTYVRRDAIIEFYEVSHPDTNERAVKIHTMDNRQYWVYILLEKFMKLMGFKPKED